MGRLSSHNRRCIGGLSGSSTISGQVPERYAPAPFA